MKLSFNHPAFAKGVEFELAGVGLVKNGSSTELDEDGERALVLRVGMSVREYFKDSEMVKVDGSPTVKVSDVIPKDMSDTVDVEAQQEAERLTQREGELLNAMEEKGEDTSGNPGDFLDYGNTITETPKKEEAKKGGEE